MQWMENPAAPESLGRQAASIGEGFTMNSFASLSPSWLALRPSLVMAQGLDHPAQEKAPAPHHADIAVDDWDLLFRAVRARLRSTVSGPVTAASGNVNSALQTQEAVLDCVAALESLHTALIYERSEMRHDVFHAD